MPCVIDASLVAPRARGFVLCLVGPDGAGKSTLAKTLVETLRARSIEVVHSYWRPGLLPMPGQLLGRPAPGLVTDPHGRPAHGRLKASLRLVHYFVDFVLGYWLVYRPVLRRGGIVIVERGWQDLLVDPRRYLLPFRAPVSVLTRFVPKPDFVAILSAPSDELYRRKQEIETSEMDRQLAVWKSTARARQGVLELDAKLTPDELADRVLRDLRPA